MTSIRGFLLGVLVIALPVPVLPHFGAATPLEIVVVLVLDFFVRQRYSEDEGRGRLRNCVTNPPAF